MTKAIIPMPTGTNVLYLGASRACARLLASSATLTVWPAGHRCGGHGHHHHHGAAVDVTSIDWYAQGYGLGYGPHQHLVCDDITYPHGIQYISMGTDLEGRFKFVLDSAWLEVTVGAGVEAKTYPARGRWDGVLTVGTCSSPVRFQLGGDCHVSSFSTSSGYASCEPANCVSC